MPKARTKRSHTERIGRFLFVTPMAFIGYGRLKADNWLSRPKG